MHHLHAYLLLSGFAPSISALPLLETRQFGGIVGVATFNDYANQQGGEVCKNAGIATTADNKGVYKAAAGDISPDLSSGLCDGSNSNPNFQYDMSKCTSDGGVIPTYAHPSCNNARVKCGACFEVANYGAYQTNTGSQIGKSIVVQIVDACPAGSALNYCKVKANPPIPADERCGAGNSLDIDYSAYKDLTGTDYASSNKANLKIHITAGVPCTAGAGGSAGNGSPQVSRTQGNSQGASSQGGGSKQAGSSQGGSTQGAGTQGSGAQGSGAQGGNAQGAGPSQQGSTASQQSGGTSQQGGNSQGGNIVTQGSTSNSQSGNLSTTYNPNSNPDSSYQSQQQSGNGRPNTGNGASGYNNPQGSGQSGQQQVTPNTGSGNPGSGTGGGVPGFPGGLIGLLQSGGQSGVESGGQPRGPPFGQPGGMPAGGPSGGLPQKFGLGGII